jgi:AcrR family transcriptional regulator
VAKATRRTNRIERGDSAEDILNVAADLFRRDGYERTRLATIGERLGMTAAAIYYHFPSKEDLLVAYLQRALGEVVARTEAALAPLTRPEDRLRAFTETYVMFHLELLEPLSSAEPSSRPPSPATHGFSQLIDGLGATHRNRMAKQLQSYVELLRTIVREGIDDGTFRDVNVTAAAFAILGMVEHASLWFRPDGPTRSDEVTSLYGVFAVEMLRAD